MIFGSPQLAAGIPFAGERFSLFLSFRHPTFGRESFIKMANISHQECVQSLALPPLEGQPASKGKSTTNDIAHVERVTSTSDLENEHMNYERVDKELAKYAQATAIEISPEENKRLKQMIDRRILTIMVFTYFLQALDKGTMSFASIMGIREDAHLDAKSNQVIPSFSTAVDHGICWSRILN